MWPAPAGHTFSIMKFDIITIFPEMFNDFMSQSLIARAIKKRLISIKTHDLRAWTKDNHKSVDGRPYGGGAGMVMLVEPIMKAVKKIRGKKKYRVILMSAKGKQFTQRDALRLSKYDQLIFVCGRYEGVDERVAKHIADEEMAIGPYVLFGGEVPAMVVTEAVSRLVPEVIKFESLQEESHWNQLLKNEATDRESLEYPHYTRPDVIEIDGKKRRVPKVLMSGNHAEINAWRAERRKATQ